MKKKANRLDAIKMIISSKDISSQEELLQALDKVVRFEAEGDVRPVNKIALYGTDNTKLMVIEKK